MKPIKEIYPLLPGPRTTVITTHQKPDADAMGSSLALYHFLRQFGHEVTVISPTNWANWVNWMPGAKEVIDYEMDKQKADAILDKADWVFCLDFNIFHRTKTMEEKLRQITCTKILIDHHQAPDVASFDYGVSDTGKSSTCELVYNFIADSGFADKINRDMCECIYAGIIADTGSFRFHNATAQTHQLVMSLKEKGFDHTYVHEQLYDNYLENRLRFIGNILSNRLEIFYEYNTALIAIPKIDIQKFDIKTGDTEDIVNLPLAIRGIKLVGFLVDRGEERRWSFRSKGDFDCNTFARKYFEGGGHFNAAGGRSSDTFEKTLQHFKFAMKENKNLLQ